MFKVKLIEKLQLVNWEFKLNKHQNSGISMSTSINVNSDMTLRLFYTYTFTLEALVSQWSQINKIVNIFDNDTEDESITSYLERICIGTGPDFPIKSIFSYLN